MTCGSSHDNEHEADARRDPQDELILAVLVAGGSYEDAAAAGGVSARTVRRRMSNEDFAAEVRSRRAERATRISAALLDIGHQAIAVLSEAMEDDNPAIRLKASQAALTLGQRYRRETEMMDRIEALERRADAERTGKPITNNEVSHAQS